MNWNLIIIAYPSYLKSKLSSFNTYNRALYTLSVIEYNQASCIGGFNGCNAALYTVSVNKYNQALYIIRFDGNNALGSVELNRCNEALYDGRDDELQQSIMCCQI